MQRKLANVSGKKLPVWRCHCRRRPELAMHETNTSNPSTKCCPPVLLSLLPPSSSGVQHIVGALHRHLAAPAGWPALRNCQKLFAAGASVSKTPRHCKGSKGVRARPRRAVATSMESYLGGLGTYTFSKTCQHRLKYFSVSLISCEECFCPCLPMIRNI